MMVRLNTIGMQLDDTADDMEDEIAAARDALDGGVDIDIAPTGAADIGGTSASGPTPYLIVDGPSAAPHPVPDFHLALMLFASSADISHTQYKALREVLKLSTPDTIASLPETLTTLKSQCRRNMPLQQICAYKVQLELPSLPPRTKTPGVAYWFELQEYCRLWLTNPTICGALHQGLGVITYDRACSEFYHGDAWLGSVHTTSGEFAYLSDAAYEATSMAFREPLLPSDCVEYLDGEPGLGARKGRAGAVLSCLGRVMGIGLDEATGRPAAIIQRLLPRSDLPAGWRERWEALVSGITETASEQCPFLEAP